MRYLPNLITILRILLTVPFAWTLLHGDFGSALALFVVAGISDGIDGFLAKHFDWESRLGAILDPLADKLLLVSAYLGLGWLHRLPWWLVALVLARDAIIVGGATAYHFVVGRFEMEPLISSKVNTFAQIVLVVLVVLAAWHGFPSPPWLVGGQYLVAATTMLSGTIYVWTWSRRALRNGRRA